MTVEWRFVNGEVYRLAESFESLADARTLVFDLQKKQYLVFLSMVDDRWAVYWRPKKAITPCGAYCYSVHA